MGGVAAPHDRGAQGGVPPDNNQVLLMYPRSASGKNTTSSPTIHANVQPTWVATGPPSISPRTALTRCESGLTFTNACSQPGIVEACTNALLPNDSGNMSRNMTPRTAPAVRTVMPTHSETHA